jgi:hypothetical protein
MFRLIILYPSNIILIIDLFVRHWPVFVRWGESKLLKARQRNSCGRRQELNEHLMAKDAKNMDLDELAQQMHLRPDSMSHLAAHAEFIRRQTDAQLEAARAQIVAARAEEMAAKASIATADATKKNARYLLAAVIAAAISALASAMAACYTYWAMVK